MMTMRLAPISRLTLLASGALLSGMAIAGLVSGALHSRKPKPVASAAQAPALFRPAEFAASEFAPAELFSPALKNSPVNLAGVAEALRAYHDGKGPVGDAALAAADPLARAAALWVFLRAHPSEAGLQPTASSSPRIRTGRPPCCAVTPKTWRASTTSIPAAARARLSRGVSAHPAPPANSRRRCSTRTDPRAKPRGGCGAPEDLTTALEHRLTRRSAAR